MKNIRSLVLTCLLTIGSLGLAGAESAATPSPAKAQVSAPSAVVAQATVESKPAKKGKEAKAKDPVKQLRGKLLYERNRIRKLEKDAEARNPELVKQIQELENKKEELYVAAQPALAERYANEKAYLVQIEEMTQQK